MFKCSYTCLTAVIKELGGPGIIIQIDESLFKPQSQVQQG